MADTPISGLPAAGAANAADEFAVNQAGTTRKVTGTQVSTVVLAAHIAANPIDHPNGSVTAAKIADRTRKLFVVPYTAHNRDGASWDYMGQSTAVVGLGIDVIDDEYVMIYGRFMVPHDYVSDMTAQPVWCIEQGVAGSPKDIYIETIAHAGTCGEDNSLHHDTLPFAAVSVVVPAGIISPIYECTPALSLVSVALNDMVRLETTRDSTAATGGLDTLGDRCVFIGWIVSYTADS